MSKKFFMFLFVCTLLFGSCLTAHAEEAVTSPAVFDAQYYAQNNPDVVAVFGNDPAALYQHYVNHGEAEGRLPYANADLEAIALLRPRYSAEQVKCFTREQVKEMSDMDFFWYLESAYDHNIMGDAYTLFGSIMSRVYPGLFDGSCWIGLQEYYDLSSFDSFARDYHNLALYECLSPSQMNDLKAVILHTGKYYGGEFPGTYPEKPRRIINDTTIHLKGSIPNKEDVYEIVDSCNSFLQKHYGIAITYKNFYSYTRSIGASREDFEPSYYLELEFAKVN